MIKNIGVLASVLFFASCTPSGLKYSAESVASFWNTEDYDVSDSGETGNKMIILGINNLPGVRTNYPLKNVADVTATKFVDILQEKDKEGYTHVKIKIKSNGISFEKKYQLSEIILAQKFGKISQSIFLKINESDFSFIENMFAEDKFSGIEKRNIKGMFQKIDSTEGKCKSISLISFDLKSVDEDKKPVIVIHVDVSYKNSFADYMLVYRIKDEKIIHFGINEKSKY